jgi:hypothetical protein
LIPVMLTAVANQSTSHLLYFLDELFPLQRTTSSPYLRT